MQLPIFQKLSNSNSVLIAGAGGGFDVFAGLPLYLWLKGLNKTVHLANLSFSDLSYAEEDKPIPELAIVTPSTSGSTTYFPERHLADWLEQKGIVTPVYATQRTGAAGVRRAYEWLQSTLQVDTIVLIDGGTDILMTGDEAGLGTPQEDAASLAAVDAQSEVLHRFVLCLGFGIDTYHGVCHAQFLENVGKLSVDGGYLGSWSLLWEMPEVQLYADALRYAHNLMPHRTSIVNSSIVSAVQGYFGDHHSMERTKHSELFINPLMAQYWAFDLAAVARRNLYLDQIRSTETYNELSTAIERFRNTLPHVRPWISIPF